MTTISKMELINRMKKRLIATKEEHNKVIKSLNKQNSRILKNFRQYNELTLSPISVEDSLTELISKLNINIESSNIQIINADNVNIEDVFTSFYNSTPPFSPNEKKRYEFPDAFILKSVETWCKSNRKKMIFLSKDNDFNGYKSRHLLFRNNIVELLGQITNYYDSIQENQIIPSIKRQIETNKEGILLLINEQLEDIIQLDVDFENYSRLELFKLKLHSYKITSIKPELAEITYLFEINYKFTVFPSSNDIKENIFEDNLKPKRYSGKLTIPADFEIGLTRANAINLKWINSNEKIRLTTINNYS